MQPRNPRDTFDLERYYREFPEALRGRYDGRDFGEDFDWIEKRFQRVRSDLTRGGDITVDDVMAIFDPRLPYVCDWTKPDKQDLAERMEKRDVSRLLRDLNGGYDRGLLGQIINGFRELSLTALVLHHVYPKTYSMCSHHIAASLCITGPKRAGTVAEFYLDFCKELKVWGERWELTVVQAEFGLWTWYWFAKRGPKEARKEHQRNFERDSWVRKRRTTKIEESLEVEDAMRLARFLVNSDRDPTLGAIIAWREFEVKARYLFQVWLAGGGPKDPEMAEVLKRLPEAPDVDYRKLWKDRNSVMHQDRKLDPETARGAWME